MKLPEGEHALVDLAKLRDYCLSASHALGRYKARVFASVLGITSADAVYLREELLRAACEEEAAPGVVDEYGARYTIDFEIVRGDRRAVIRSAWIVLRGETVPRLTSCYVRLN